MPTRNTLSLHFRRADVLFLKGEYREAVAEYGEAIRLSPTFAEGYCGRGNAWRNQGEFGKAMKDYDQVLLARREIRACLA